MTEIGNFCITNSESTCRNRSKTNAGIVHDLKLRDHTKSISKPRNKSRKSKKTKSKSKKLKVNTTEKVMKKGSNVEPLFWDP